MKKFACLITIFFSARFCNAQDEIIKVGEQVAIDYELKITKISSDTLFFIAFRKSEFLLMRNVLVYKVKGSNWTWARPEEKEKYIFKEGRLLFKHLQPEFILRQFEISLSNEKQIKQLKHYKIIFTLNSQKKTLTSDGEICFTLISDTTNSIFILRLKKIYKDSLFLFSRIKDDKRIYRFSIEDFKEIAFNTDVQKMLNLFTAPSMDREAITSQGLLIYLMTVPHKFAASENSYEIVPVSDN